MKMSSKVMDVEEARAWRQKIPRSVSARALVFARAEEANSPFVIEVTRGQGPDGKNLIIHIVKRADIHPDLAIKIVQHALVDVFGADAGKQAECDYRNVIELKKKYGRDVVPEDHDAMTIIFDQGPIAYTHSPTWVRDKLALALGKWSRANW